MSTEVMMLEEPCVDMILTMHSWVPYFCSLAPGLFLKQGRAWYLFSHV